MNHEPPYAVYINPITGEQQSTKFVRGLDLVVEGWIFLNDFNEIYDCDIQPTVDIS